MLNCMLSLPLAAAQSSAADACMTTLAAAGILLLLPVSSTRFNAEHDLQTIRAARLL